MLQGNLKTLCRSRCDPLSALTLGISYCRFQISYLEFEICYLQSQSLAGLAPCCFQPAQWDKLLAFQFTGYPDRKSRAFADFAVDMHGAA